MPFADILETHGQIRAVERLRAAVHGQRLHHAFLLTGPAGVGVAELASVFAQGLVCPNDPEGDGTCPACDRARRGLHPDLLTIGLDREGGAREVKVEAVRELCAALQLRPSEAPRKVALVLDADRLSPSAQNALLKTLEEPPPHTVLVLASEAEERLLPTVRSRCLRVSLTPLNEALLVRTLIARSPASAKLELETAQLLARLARGSIARAERFGGGFRQRRERLLTLVHQLLTARGKPAGALLALEAAQEFGADREQAAEAIDLLAAYLRDLLVLHGLEKGGADRGRRLLTPDRLAELDQLGQTLSPLELSSGLEGLHEAALALESNGGPRLQLEAAALRLAGFAA